VSVFFILQKTILLLLLPPSGTLLIVLAGFMVYKKKDKGTGIKIMVTGITLLYLLSTSIVSNMLIRPLENDHPPFSEVEKEPGAIVVLTGGVQDLSYLGLTPQPSKTSVARLMQGIALSRRYPNLPLIICGGSGDPARPDLSEARALADMAAAAGVSKKSIVIEDRSVNTKEGAINVGKLLGDTERDILLVTSAYHMDRSVRFFKRTGFSVIPAPADYQSSTVIPSLFLLIPSAGHLKTSSTAIYEYLSRLRYGMLF